MARRSQLSLLRDTVEKRAPGYLNLTDKLMVRPLTEEEREVLRHVIAGELVEVGLDGNDEPTAYGMELEAVIDWLGSR